MNQQSQYALSLRDQIAQMLLIGFDGHKLEIRSPIMKEIKDNHVGGVILFDYDCINQKPGKNILNASQLTSLIDELKTIAHDAELPPLFIAIDYEGGKVNRLKEANGFVPTRSAAELGRLPLDEVKDHAITMAEQLHHLGINLNFNPCIDMAINPDNPVIVAKDRAFSDKAHDIVQYARHMGNAFSAHNILYAPKHFPGHGSSHTDTHHGFVDITDTWQEIELSPFKAVIQSDSPPPMIMTAHLIHRELDPTGVPATLSRPILTNLLREELKFEGLIISDDMQMRAISDNYTMKHAVVQAIDAGVDILLFGNQLASTTQSITQLIDWIEDAVYTGTLTEERITQSYNRICDAKRWMN